VFTPQTGDNVQAVKAGLTEVGDIYVINKSDLEGSSILYSTILDLIGDTIRKPLVMKTSSKTGKGIKDLAGAIDKSLGNKSISYKARQQKMLEDEIKDMILDIVEANVVRALASEKKFAKVIEQLIKKETDPYSAADKIAQDILR
jgi:LAO/AO transport system kinase